MKRCAHCDKGFEPTRKRHDFCSRACQLKGRRKVVTPERATHLVIPDTQCKPGVPNDHLRWINQYALDRYAGKPLTVVHIGDHWDMPSLSSYDRGKGKMEGRRYVADITAGNRGFEILTKGWVDQPQWDLHFCFGNHEDRISRAIENDIQLDGILSLDHCETGGFMRHEFREPVWLDGVCYSHYFYHPMTGRAYGGENVELRLKTIGHSFTMGHQQGFKWGSRFVGGREICGMVAGSCYQHDEEYLGPQANAHWRGIVVCNNVNDGSYDLMRVGLDYLCNRYEGHGIADHRGVEL